MMDSVKTSELTSIVKFLASHNTTTDDKPFKKIMKRFQANTMKGITVLNIMKHYIDSTLESRKEELNRLRNEFYPRCVHIEPSQYTHGEKYVAGELCIAPEEAVISAYLQYNEEGTPEESGYYCISGRARWTLSLLRIVNKAYLHGKTLDSLRHMH
jgi:hypothetical protein